jgi:hypothetical protein
MNRLPTGVGSRALARASTFVGSRALARASTVLVLSVLGIAACSAEKSASAASTQSAVADHQEHPPPAIGQALTVEPPPGARVFFETPSNGATLSGPLVDGKLTFPVKMGVESIVVRPAGEIVKGTGHHHIIVDGEAIPLGTIVPKDETHLHFGKGQTSAELELPPGDHTLTLQFADGAHMSYGPTLASTIKVKVLAP